MTLGRATETGSASGSGLPRYGDRRRMRIGVLGGSFNPAHGGHRHIAEVALARLRLHQVWLLVSPGNPLKNGNDMASLTVRLASAHAIGDGRRILATDIERHFGSRYTLDSLRSLRTRFPRARFVWLMGADNLSQFPRWLGWRGIAATVPFAVLPRPSYNHQALAGQAATRLRAARRLARSASVLAGQAPPAWIFLEVRQDAASATELRHAASGESRSPESPPCRHPQDRATPSAARQNRP